MMKIMMINTKNSKIAGVTTKDNNIFNSNFVVSNSDSTELFSKLLKIKNNPAIKIMNKLVPSPSAFIVYLGLNINLKEFLNTQCTHWYFSDLDIESAYGDIESQIYKDNLPYIISTVSSMHDGTAAPVGSSTLSLFLYAPFKTGEFWDKYRQTLTTKMIKKAREIFPFLLDKHIVECVTATPHTFYKYTSNRKGALYGWASTVNQVDRAISPQKSFIDGLYTCGHWSSSGLGQGGVPSVAYTGRIAAQHMLGKDARKR
jgi:prolycopene isomerase